jgi:hypothetical protein
MHNILYPVKDHPMHQDCNEHEYKATVAGAPSDSG